MIKPIFSLRRHPTMPAPCTFEANRHTIAHGTMHTIICIDQHGRTEHVDKDVV